MSMPSSMMRTATGVVVLHCLVCDSLLDASLGDVRCEHSSGRRVGSAIEIHGPCRALFIYASGIVASSRDEWPDDAPRVILRPVPPLL